MNEYDLPFVTYKECPVCNGHGHVFLAMTNDDELSKWQEKLKIDFPAIYGYNSCMNCEMTGFVIEKELEDLELE